MPQTEELSPQPSRPLKASQGHSGCGPGPDTLVLPSRWAGSRTQARAANSAVHRCWRHPECSPLAAGVLRPQRSGCSWGAPDPGNLPCTRAPAASLQEGAAFRRPPRGGVAGGRDVCNALTIKVLSPTGSRVTGCGCTGPWPAWPLTPGGCREPSSEGPHLASLGLEVRTGESWTV